MEAEIKNFLRQQGAELTGITTVEKIPPYHPQRKPSDIIPGARSVLVIGIPMLNGAACSNSRVASIHTRAMFEELNRLSYQAGRYLERLGHQAAPIPPYLPLEMSRETKGFSGELSLKHLAVAAGLGVLGKSRLLITPEFGPRVYFGAVVTDAPLKGDSQLQGELCPSGCSNCLDNCPGGALRAPYEVDVNKCYFTVQSKGLGPLSRYLSNLNPENREEWKKAFCAPIFWDYYQTGALGLQYECYQCLINCPVGKL